jgi:hypothetical protein
VYDAIERLTAMGVIDRAMVIAKPYSRKQAARYVGRAIDRIRDNEVQVENAEAIAGPLLDRLTRELRPELRELGAVSAPGEAKLGLFRYGARFQLEPDIFSVGSGTVRFRENRGGEYYANGVQAQADVRGWLEVSDYFSLTMQPKFISNRHALGIGATNNSHNVYMREFNAKLAAFNVALEIGRGTQWWGPGYRGSLLLTDHAFPLDMIKLGSDNPFKLPWIFKPLGDWKLNAFLTQLERDRDFPRAKVFGLRLSYQPADWLELGITRLTQFNGRGRSQSFPKAVLKAYFSEPNQLGSTDVNEQAMIDFKVRIPKISYLNPFPSGLQLYGEIGSEDKWSQYPLPSRAAFLGGIYIPQLFSGDSTDFRVEYADTDLSRRKTGLPDVWYDSATYQSGMRYRGFPLGHWMGTDAIDLYIRSTRYMTDDIQVGINLDFSERAKGLPVYEKKAEGGIDLTWWKSKETQFSVGYTYQNIKNPGQITSINPFVETFAAGVTSNNHFLWTNLTWNF